MSPDDMKLIDSHCHLDFPQFESCLLSVIKKAKSKCVQHFVVPGVKQQTFDNLILLAQKYSEISIALGLHPYFIDDHSPDDLKTLECYLQSNPVCAVGEIGLDYQLENYDAEKQSFYFDSQLKLAQNYHLPVIVHVRKAHDQVLKHLRKLKFKEGGVIHAFNGSFQQAEQYVELGFKLGFGGVATYPRASKLRKLVAELPLTAIVLETDSPDMPLYNQQMEFNEPANVAEVLEVVGSLRSESKEEIAQTTTENVQSVLRFSI